MWVSFLFSTFREVLREADKVTLANHCSAVLFYIVALTYLYMISPTQPMSSLLSCCGNVERRLGVLTESCNNELVNMQLGFGCYLSSITPLDPLWNLIVYFQDTDAVMLLVAHLFVHF